MTVLVVALIFLILLGACGFAAFRNQYGFSIFSGICAFFMMLGLLSTLAK